MKVNPFKPNSIVGPGMFVGRLEELLELDRCLFQTKHGNPRHFLIHGERGIGKSSLMLVAESMATGEIPGPESKHRYDFMTAKLEMSPSTTYGDAIAKMGREIAKEVRKKEAVKSAAGDLWNFLKRWEVMGLKYNAEDHLQASEMLEDLCDVIERIFSSLHDCDGLFLLIDEADNATDDARLGELVKLFTERLTRIGVHNVILGISGISNVIQKLHKSHESAPRILNHIYLEPLSEDERKTVVRRGIEESNDRGGTQTRVQPEAEDWISRFSEGYPHFVQQYASTAFDTDNDDVITESDVMHGAFKENGALDQLGVRYFKEMYSSQINSDEYRQVLQVMAESPDKYVPRKQIELKTGLKKTTLSNALRALRSREIILSHPDKKGLYRLPTDSFALWIRMKSQQNQEHDKKAF